MRLPQMPPLHLPFAPGAPVRSLQDVQRIEARPLAEALPVQSNYEIFVNSAAAFGDKTALTFLPTADPAAEPIRWSYAQLLILNPAVAAMRRADSRALAGTYAVLAHSPYG